MDLAASSSAAPTTEPPMVERAREKHKRKIADSLCGLKLEEQVEFLIRRMTEAELNSSDQKKEGEQLRRENAKLSAKLGAADKLLSKTEVAKSKLEQLCRELQKSQKEEKEQNQLRCKQMQAVHAETVDSFKKSLAEIQQSVEAKQEHSRRVADVEKLSSSLNQLTADYETRLTELKKLYEERESDLGVLAKAKDSELAGLHSQMEEMQKRVREVFTENVELKRELLLSEDRVKKAIESEIGLRKLLEDYSKKYAALTKSLDKSNSSFDKVKEQMGKMNGNLIRMESDARKWKGKAEEAASIVKTLREEKAETEKTLALKDRQLKQLQELCRRLQKGGGEREMEDGEETKGERDREEKGRDWEGTEKQQMESGELLDGNGTTPTTHK